MTTEEISKLVKASVEEDKRLTRAYFKPLFISESFSMLEGHRVEKIVYSDNYGYDDDDGYNLYNIFKTDQGIVVISNGNGVGSEIYPGSGIRMGMEQLDDDVPYRNFLYWSTEATSYNNSLTHNQPALEEAIKLGLADKALLNYALKKSADMQKLSEQRQEIGLKAEIEQAKQRLAELEAKAK